MFALAHPAYIRIKAREMRTERLMTLDEIAARLAIPKTTVWYWIQDLPLTAPGEYLNTKKRSAAQLRAARANAERARIARDDAYQRGRHEFAELALDPTFRDFVCMYIGEGYRRSRNAVALANSHPAVVRLADRWIRRLASNGVSYSFQYHADQDPEHLKRFWANELSVDEYCIRAQPKSNSGRLKGRQWRCRWGVLTVLSNDTELRARLEAWMDCVREQWVDSASPGV